MRVGSFRRGDYFLLIVCCLAVADIKFNGIVKKDGLLGYQGDFILRELLSPAVCPDHQ
jgi:hypothetical protein